MNDSQDTPDTPDSVDPNATTASEGTAGGDKPAILQESAFTIEEGFAYKVCRTGAIWSNKLFFSALFLLGVWLIVGYAGGVDACSSGLGMQGSNATQEVDAVNNGTCSVFLTTTSLYLGAMAFLSFAASIVFGLVGLVVGKRILETTAASEEAGAPEREADDDGAP